jgi:hypothetical protein
MPTSERNGIWQDSGARAAQTTTLNARTESPVFKTNVGTIDRAIRLLVGLLLITLVFVGPKSVWGWVGIVPILTAILGTCPIYSLLGFNTCEAKAAPR